jgi:tyrosinase
MNLKYACASIQIPLRPRIIISHILLFLSGLILFTQLASFTPSANAIIFTRDGVRPVDVLNYEGLGYSYDTVPVQDPTANLRIRKNVANLTSDEISKFINAVTTLKSTMTLGRDGTPISIYDQFVATHLGTTDVAGRLSPDGRRFSNPAHGNAAFLPWHRNFLLEFERLLQGIDPSVTVPYWDFTNSFVTQNIIFQNNFIGPNGGSGGVGGGAVQSGFFSAANGWLQRTDLSGNTWMGRSTSTQPLTRYLRSSDRLPTTTQVNQTLAQTSYDNFRNSLELQAHAGAHLWVGGSTAFVGSSPNDSIFWLLHTNIDRLWALWQINGHWGNSWYPTNGKPYGHNLNDLMWPWDKGRMSAAADLQALIPGSSSTQASSSSLLRSAKFRIASSPEELMSDKTGHLYNPFFNDNNHMMNHDMLCDENKDTHATCSKNMDNIAALSTLTSNGT